MGLTILKVKADADFSVSSLAQCAVELWKDRLFLVFTVEGLLELGLPTEVPRGGCMCCLW